MKKNCCPPDGQIFARRLVQTSFNVGLRSPCPCRPLLLFLRVRTSPFAQGRCKQLAAACLDAMPASGAQTRKRALVAGLLALAAAHSFRVSVTRDSSDAAVAAAAKRAVAKVSARPASAQRLREATDAWAAAKAQPSKPGRRARGPAFMAIIEGEAGKYWGCKTPGVPLRGDESFSSWAGLGDAAMRAQTRGEVSVKPPSRRILTC